MASEKLPKHLLTRWGEFALNVAPTGWQEYPRPQMVRPDWLNLNGIWNYCITEKNNRRWKAEDDILVPFPIESALSGVQRALLPDERLWYRRFRH